MARLEYSMLVAFFIFVLVVFVYLHTVAQFKTSQDVEVYESAFEDAAALQDVCDLRQPVVFDLASAGADFFREASLDAVLGAGARCSVWLKDADDYRSDLARVDAVAMRFDRALKLADADTRARYFSDGNRAFMEESGLDTTVRALDALVKPPYAVQTHYDLMFGAKGAATPMTYGLDHRRFVVVCAGRVIVKMAPPKSGTYLHEARDYETLEFRARVDPWSPQPRYADDVSRVRFLDFAVDAGSALFVPAYWWYSIKYEADTYAVACVYNTVFNRLAHAPQLMRHMLQRTLPGDRISVSSRKDIADVEEEAEADVAEEAVHEPERALENPKNDK